MDGWQPIETAPKKTEVLVCDTQDGLMPFTIARCHYTAGAWRYGGAVMEDCDEEIDFEPLFWMDRHGKSNPFKQELPA